MPGIVRAQDYPALEVVIVDNSSSDDTHPFSSAILSQAFLEQDQ